MSTRFFTNLVTALFGGFVVVASLTFTHGAAAWVAFGFALAVLAITAVAQLDQARSLEQRLVDVPMALTAAAMVVASLVYSGTTVMWVVFALALGWVGIATSGLFLREVSVWRSSHGLAQLRPFERVLELRTDVATGQATVGSRIA